MDLLRSATYESDHGRLRVDLERIDVLIQSESEIVNFPRLVRLDGDCLILPYGRGRHGGAESRLAALSEDGGLNWVDCPPDSPWNDNVQTSGILGYLRDGTVAYIDVFPLEMGDWKGLKTPWYANHVADPTWRLRRFSGAGELLNDGVFHVSGLPWEAAAYYCYGDLLDFGDGELLVALGAQVPGDLSPGEGSQGADTRPGSIRITTFFARSRDHGASFAYVTHIPPLLDGVPFGPEGFNEPTMVRLPDGEIICVLRTGSHSPLYQVRSGDGGNTWSEPVSTGWPAAKPDLCLLSNGVLACTSGRGNFGHPQVTHAMFSLDGRGQHWETPFVFHTGPGCSYTSNMERDGLLYVAYSDSSFTRPRDEYDAPYQAIKWAVLRAELSNRGDNAP